MNSTDTTFAVGDSAWVLNGIRSRAFRGLVTDVHGDVVTIRNLDKRDQEQKFFASTGEPANLVEWREDALLPKMVHDSDPEVVAILEAMNRRKPAIRANEIISQLSTMLRDDAAFDESFVAGLFDELSEQVEQWRRVALP